MAEKPLVLIKRINLCDFKVTIYKKSRWITMETFQGRFKQSYYQCHLRKTKSWTMRGYIKRLIREGYVIEC
ncbi:hypothetical protein EP56_05550 [Listeriaceae bacterium FSL A5-0209]|nr:hypothetical protein EP56_05550 [Listeriaceae bacterium FSL A5-0209]